MSKNSNILGRISRNLKAMNFRKNTFTPVAYLGGDALLKMGFQTYIFCSKVPSICRKCRFRDPNFKMGFQTYIPQNAGNAVSETQISNNLWGGGKPLQLCRHYGLPLTKILATPLVYTLWLIGPISYLGACYIRTKVTKYNPWFPVRK